MYIFGHQVTLAEVKVFVLEASAIAGEVTTLVHSEHLTAFYDGLGIVSSVLLAISHALNVKTNAAIKVAATKDPS
jgi:hypothetical protein